MANGRRSTKERDHDGQCRQAPAQLQPLGHLLLSFRLLLRFLKFDFAIEETVRSSNRSRSRSPRFMSMRRIN